MARGVIRGRAGGIVAAGGVVGGAVDFSGARVVQSGVGGRARQRGGSAGIGTRLTACRRHCSVPESVGSFQKGEAVEWVFHVRGGRAGQNGGAALELSTRALVCHRHYSVPEGGGGFPF